MNGQTQFIYQDLEDPDIGSLVDPSLLTSDSTDAIALQGRFQSFIAGSGDTLFAASATAFRTSRAPEHCVNGNRQQGLRRPGLVRVQSFMGGNQVIQQSAAAADAGTVNAFQNAVGQYSGQTANQQLAFLGSTSAPLAYSVLQNNPTLGQLYSVIQSNPPLTQLFTVLQSNPVPGAAFLQRPAEQSALGRSCSPSCKAIRPLGQLYSVLQNNPSSTQVFNALQGNAPLTQLYTAQLTDQSSPGADV